MKQLLKLFMSLLLIISFGCSIEQGDIPKDGEDGKDGISYLVRLVEQEDGVLILVGADTNNDGYLDDNEVTQSTLVSNGQDGEDGYNSLIRTESIEDGYIIYFGLDLDRNGYLDEGEETSQIVLRNGIDGEDGLNSLISIVEITEEMESECEEGIRIYSGLDDNRDGVLDEEEIDFYYDVCKCECECPELPYYEIEVVHKEEEAGCLRALKITKGVVGYPELETTEYYCF